MEEGRSRLTSIKGSTLNNDNKNNDGDNDNDSDNNNSDDNNNNNNNNKWGVMLIRDYDNKNNKTIKI